MEGFSTANGKGIQVSEAALLKARSLFEDDEFELPTNCSVSGFSMASGKTFTISEAALQKAKRLFEDSPDKSSVQSTTFKTPGPPVSACFELKSSRQDCGLTSKVKPPQPKVTLQTAVKRKYEASSHMTTEPKRLKYQRTEEVPSLLELNGGRSLGMSSEAQSHLLSINSRTALAYKFGCPCLIDLECYCDGRLEVSWQQCIQVLGKRKRICTEEWMKRHYRLVVWKYAGIARRVKSCTGVFSIKRVLDCLEKRYVKEVDLGRKSVLHRVGEGDEFPNCHLVLCVGEVRPTANSYLVELTDGWSSMESEVVASDLLYSVLASGKIAEGVKLRLYGTLKVEGRLKLCYNGVRRARWHARLGKGPKLPFRVNLKSIKTQGGTVPSVCVRVQRVFPPVYCSEVKGQRYCSQQPKSDEARPSLLVRVQDCLGDAVPTQGTQVYVRFWKGALGLYDEMRVGDCYTLLNLVPGHVSKHGLGVLHFNSHSYMMPSTQPKRLVQAYDQEIDLTMKLTSVNKTFCGEVKSLTGRREEVEVTVELHSTGFFSMNLSSLALNASLVIETVVQTRPTVYLTCDETQIKVRK
jgi:hypothetical protein